MKNLKFATAALVAFVGVLALVLSAARPARAQQGVGDLVSSGNIPVGSVAVVVTATDSATPVVVRSMILTGTTSGLYTFHDGTTGSGATRVGLMNFYLVANTPTEVRPEFLTGIYGPKGTSTTAGNSLQAVGPSGSTLIFAIRSGPR